MAVVHSVRPRALPGGQLPFRLQLVKGQPEDSAPTPRLTPSSTCMGSPGRRRFSFAHSYSPISGRRNSAKFRPSLRPALQRFSESLAVNDCMFALDMVRDALEAGASVSRKEFCFAVDEKRRTCPELFVAAINRMVATIHSQHFPSESTDTQLPTHVMQYALSFLELREHQTLCAVSRAWRTMAEADCLWLPFYLERFRFHDVESAEPREGLAKHHFARRLRDPARGDRIEVAWRGKFRLEFLEIFHGLAWWVAEIVDKGPNGRYRVHYPGWEARWDEWVPRDRLRWGNERRAAQLKGRKPSAGDLVEMWCGGVHVPGAWLEATVCGVKGNRLYLGEILTTGHFWAETEKVRLVKTARQTDRPTSDAHASGGDGEEGDDGSAGDRTSPLCPTFRFGGAGAGAMGGGGGGGGCSIM